MQPFCMTLQSHHGNERKPAVLSRYAIASTVGFRLDVANATQLLSPTDDASTQLWSAN